jgi:hypothetical protein
LVFSTVPFCQGEAVLFLVANAEHDQPAEDGFSFFVPMGL